MAKPMISTGAAGAAAPKEDASLLGAFSGNRLRSGLALAASLAAAALLCGCGDTAIPAAVEETAKALGLPNVRADKDGTFVAGAWLDAKGQHVVPQQAANFRLMHADFLVPQQAANFAAAGANATAAQRQVSALSEKLARCQRKVEAARSAELTKKGEDDACQREVEQLRRQTKAAAAGDGEADALRAELARALRRMEDAEASAAAVGQLAQAARKPWPECARRGMAFRGPPFSHKPLLEDVGAVFGSAAAGCRAGNCSATDRTALSRPEECAHLCGALPRCALWSFSGDDRACSFQGGGGGHAEAALDPGLVSGARGCRPQPTEVPAAQAALAVLEAPALAACDGGPGPACPDLRGAMRTWAYGIQNLQLALQGTKTDLHRHLRTISEDVQAFLGAQATEEQLGEMYEVAAANNRLVFDAMRGFLSQQRTTEAEAKARRLDASVPRPARGLLCQAGSCAAGGA